jgi:hypothetical protein
MLNRANNWINYESMVYISSTPIIKKIGKIKKKINPKPGNS